MSFANFRQAAAIQSHAKCSDRFRLETVSMDSGKLLQFPMRNPDLFSREINYQVLSSSEFNRILYAAIRALPHVKSKTKAGQTSKKQEDAAPKNTTPESSTPGEQNMTLFAAQQK
jgi:hypothetical protein